MSSLGIWRFHEVSKSWIVMGIPLNSNHPFFWMDFHGFSIFMGSPIYGNPHIMKIDVDK